MTDFARGYGKKVKLGKTNATLRTKTTLPDYIARDGSARFIEQTQSPEFWDCLDLDSAPTDSDLSNSQLEALDEAKEELVRHILDNLPQVLTARQLQIFLCFLQGDKTQGQIAEEIGISARGAISYSLHGQLKGDRRIGGSIPALQEWAAQDETCQRLLVKINKIISEDPDEDRLIRG